MANLPNLIATDVAALQDDELQSITRKLDETLKEKDSLTMENGTLKLINEELKKLLDEKNKLLEEKDKLLEEKENELDKLCGKLKAAEDRLNEISNFDLVCVFYCRLQ